MKVLSLVVVALSLYTSSLFAYDYSDQREASDMPPGGLSVDQVPQFVTIGFDDNSYSGLPRGGQGEGGGVTYVIDSLCRNRNNPVGSGYSGTYDNEPISVSFFVNSTYGGGSYSAESPTIVKIAWNNAYRSGHEIGNHTHSHGNGAISSVLGWTQAQWDNEIETCNDWLTKPLPDTTLNSGEAFWNTQIMQETGTGVDPVDIIGYRNPFLAYQPETFITLKKYGFIYDCSIEEGYQTDQDGTNFIWPYTLHNGSPGHNYLVSQGTKDFDIGTHEGLWELGIRPVIVPPDELCGDYGVPSGLREKLAGQVKEGSPELIRSSGKITGLDYNLWFDAKVTKAEFLAIMKYTLDLRLSGNRCPLLFGAHSDEYSTKWVGNASTKATNDERQEALVEFFEYALSKPEVRISSYAKILDWLRNPVPLSGTTNLNSALKKVCSNVINTISHKNQILSIVLNVEMNEKLSASLYTLNGQKIVSTKSIGKDVSFNIPISKGIYILNITGKTVKQNSQIVIQ